VPSCEGGVGGKGTRELFKYIHSIPSRRDGAFYYGRPLARIEGRMIYKDDSPPGSHQSARKWHPPTKLSHRRRVCPAAPRGLCNEAVTGRASQEIRVDQAVDLLRNIQSVTKCWCHEQGAVGHDLRALNQTKISFRAPWGCRPALLTVLILPAGFMRRCALAGFLGALEGACAR
jgi:hypothetical protein